MSAIVAFDLPGAHVTLACFDLARRLDAAGLPTVADLSALQRREVG